MRNFCPLEKHAFPSGQLPVQRPHSPSQYRPQEFPALPKPFTSCRQTARSHRLFQVCFLGSVALALTAIAGCHGSASVAAGRSLDFNQDVQPILASRCFACHGPDPEMRKAGLRLDLAEYAMKKRPGHPDAITPGHPERSELIKRIESHDPHYLRRQSQQGDAKPMSAGEIAVLKEWIRQGALYRPHWAFEAPTRPAVPQPKSRTDWPRNPIDNFILAKLDKAGLQP